MFKNNKMVKLKYILNNNPENEAEMKLILTNYNNNNDNIKIISYEQITHSFHKFLEQKYEEENDVNEKLKLNRVRYKYIGYSIGGGFIKLEKHDFIFLEKESKELIIKIIVHILNREKIYLKNQQNKLEIEIANIDTRVSKIKKDLKKNSFNLVVLTANPLKHKENEFRTMNDYNNIPGVIYKLLKEKEYLKYADFQPLTIDTFIDAITNDKKRPDILHLICKSTYEINNEKVLEKQTNKDIDESNFVKLIFEKDNYNSEFIDKKKLIEIFSEQKMKEGIKNMTLIISTQFAEDVYNLFQFEEIKFKNILVQFTTPADLDFVKEFNFIFYSDLIYSPLNSINDIYEDAMNIFINEKYNTFCCCFHKHKNDCELMKNYMKELYNDNNHIKKLEDLKTNIPHFCHLMPECSYTYSSRCQKYNDLCIHYKYNHKIYFDKNPKFTILNPKETKERKILVNSCCCYKEGRVHNKNINDIFFKNFEKNYLNFIYNNKLKIYVKDNYIPKYEKMELLVGKNKNVFETMEFLSSDDKYYFNIYGDNIENLKIFGNIIIEYYEERYHLNNSSIKKKKEFESIDLSDNNINYFQNELKYNKIYFIYDYLKNVQYNKLIDKKGIKNNKIIWFSEKQIDNNKIDGNQKLTPEPLLKSGEDYQNLKEYIPNEYIKFQHDRIVRNIWE